MNPRESSVTARALANVALVKYFGKRDAALNLPAAGSLSLTLEPLETNTTVELDENLEEDSVLLGGANAPEEFTARVTRFMDLVRAMSGVSTRVRVNTENSFPTAAGLASSASGFAALSVAATRAMGLELSEAETSVLARRGSGSACRSVPGGIVLWREGEVADGSDSYARTVLPAGRWDLRLVIGITDTGRKKVGSTEAMERTRKTSPFYSCWIESNRTDLEDALAAVEARDIEKLGDITERSALAMHAAALAARPAIFYWNGTTVNAFHAVVELRSKGCPAWFTCDAGPQPKVLCTSDSVDEVCRALSQISDMKNIICCKLGDGARILEG